MRKAGNFLLGAIFGGIIGGATILLLAPGSGEETQTAIRERLTNMKIEFEKAIAEKKAALEKELQEFNNQ